MSFSGGSFSGVVGWALSCILAVAVAPAGDLDLVIPDALVSILEPIPPVTSYVRQRADDAVEGRFTFQGVAGNALEPATGGIDWEYRGPMGDREWSWLLNRHQDFVNLVAVWRETEDRRYLEALDRQVRDWLKANPVPSRFSVSPGWRALEAARRVINSWVPVLAELQGVNEFPAETRRRMIASLPEHADYLMRNHHFGGNHLLTEMSALMLLAVVLPDHSEAADWSEYAMAKVQRELDIQILPDGVHRELSNHYQMIAGQAFQRVQDLSFLLSEGEEPALPVGRLEGIWDYFARVTRPNGTGPLNNDADLEFNGLLIKPEAERYNRPDWAWIATQGNRGAPPVGPAGSWYPHAGHIIFRDAWGPDALWGFLDIGPHGTDHQQNDRLHLSLSVGSEDFLVDAGRYVYRDDRWSAWFRSGAAHNIIRIDGTDPLLPGRTVPRENPSGAFVSKNWILGAGTNRFPAPRWGRGERRHARAVVFHPGGGWLVLDMIDGFGPIRVEQRWRYHPGVALTMGENQIEATRTRHGISQIAIAGPSWEAAIVSGLDRAEIDGWYSPQYNQKMPNPVWVGRAEVTGPTAIVWWFRPRYLDTANPPKWDGMQLQWDPENTGGVTIFWKRSPGVGFTPLGDFHYRVEDTES